MADDQPKEGTETSAEKAEKAKKNRRLSLKHVPLILAIVAVPFAVANVWSAAHPPAVAADFTRVGGATRVETAADAATFWLTPPAQYYEVSLRADTATVLRAANCALLHDDPMLFVPLTGKPPPADRELIANWMSTPLPHGRRSTPVPVRSSKFSCPGGSLPTRMHTWVNNEQALPGGATIRVQFAINQETDLEPFVVFAASVSPSASRLPTSPEDRSETRDLPDVAVGLALAAHIARGSKGRDVSLVVIPPYLEANPGLEESLRGQSVAVDGGIVLGETDRIPDETVALLRQILRGSDWTTTFGAVQGVITAVGAVLAALAALALGTVVATERGRRGVKKLIVKVRDILNEPPPPDTGRTPDPPAVLPQPPVGRDSYATPPGSSERPTPFIRGRRKDPRVALYLNSGGVLTGFFEGEETLGGVKVVKLSGVEISRGMPWDQPDPGAQPGPQADVTLVPATEVALAVRYSGDAGPNDQKPVEPTETMTQDSPTPQAGGPGSTDRPDPGGTSA